MTYLRESESTLRRMRSELLDFDTSDLEPQGMGEVRAELFIQASQKSPEEGLFTLRIFYGSHNGKGGYVLEHQVLGSLTRHNATMIYDGIVESLSLSPRKVVRRAITNFIDSPFRLEPSFHESPI